MSIHKKRILYSSGVQLHTNGVFLYTNGELLINMVSLCTQMVSYYQDILIELLYTDGE